MTKAERIYDKTSFMCRQIAMNADTTGVVLPSMVCDDSEIIRQRTINDIKKIIASKKHLVKTDLELGVINEVEADFENAVIDMVERTLLSQEQRLKSESE